MTRFNAWNVFKNGFTGQKNWDRQWRDPVPKKEYDAIIVGGGGHGLATAYYLAKKHTLRCAGRGLVHNLNAFFRARKGNLEMTFFFSPLHFF